MIKLFCSKALEVSESIVNKAVAIFNHTYGWITVGLMFVVSYFSPVLTIYYGLIAIILIDAVLGGLVSLKKGSYIQSYFLRETIWKWLIYTLFLAAVFIFEQTLGSESMIGSIAMFAIAGAVELISIIANAIILRPNLPFLRLAAKFLAGEIAKKLGISPEDVNEILKNQEYKNLRSEREKI